MTVPETTRPMRMHGRKMLDVLREAGIIRDGDYVRRVVIDIAIDNAVIMYVERYGDTRLLNLVRTLDGIEIQYLDGKEVHIAGGPDERV